MKKLVLLATAALVALMILVPTAMAQQTMEQTMEQTVERTVMEPLPASGGVVALAVLLPAAALLLGSGVVAYVVLRRR